MTAEFLSVLALAGGLIVCVLLMVGPNLYHMFRYWRRHREYRRLSARALWGKLTTNEEARLHYLARSLFLR